MLVAQPTATTHHHQNCEYCAATEDEDISSSNSLQPSYRKWEHGTIYSPPATESAPLPFATPRHPPHSVEDRPGCRPPRRTGKHTNRSLGSIRKNQKPTIFKWAKSLQPNCPSTGQERGRCLHLCGKEENMICIAKSSKVLPMPSMQIEGLKQR